MSGIGEIGGRDGTPTAWPDADIQRFSKDSDRIEKWRKRLKSISWFMKAIKETLYRPNDLPANSQAGSSG